MSNHTAVNVEVILNGRTIDLRIPYGVNQWQLRKVLMEAFATIGVSISPNFEMDIKSKQFTSDRLSRFDEYAIHDGDQILLYEEF